MKIIYIFPHIPKTAGQTVKYHFKKNFNSQAFLNVKTEKDMYELAKLSLSDKLKISIIHGHSIKKNIIEKFFNKDMFVIRYITFLRDPVERWISEYNYKIYTNQISKKLGLLSYFNQFNHIQKNYQIYWIYNHFLDYKIDPRLYGIEEVYKIVKNELKNFFLVGTVENFKYYSKKISDIFKIPEFSIRRNTKGIDFKIYDNGSMFVRKYFFYKTKFDRKLLLELGLL